MRRFHFSSSVVSALAALVAIVILVACGGDTQTDQNGVGAQCASDEQCVTALHEICLTQFKGGYCGTGDCQHDADCPGGSACVTHTDGKNYCFRICSDKADCNRHRYPENAANCSANVIFVDGNGSFKACVPPPR